MICLLSGTVESFSVMAPQEAQRQSLLPSASQPSASDTQLSALLAGGGCPPQLTNVDEPSHLGQLSGVAHNRKIVKKSAAQVVQKHPEDCSVSNVGTLAVKLAQHSFFGNEV